MLTMVRWRYSLILLSTLKTSHRPYREAAGRLTVDDFTNVHSAILHVDGSTGRLIGRKGFLTVHEPVDRCVE